MSGYSERPYTYGAFILLAAALVSFFSVKLWLAPGLHVPSGASAAAGVETRARAGPDAGAWLNSAGVEELSTLPGIGPELARRIIEKRAEKGGFKSIEELKEINGIGEKRLDAIREHLSAR